MRLYMAPRAPNPRRVAMFAVEKGLAGIAQTMVDLNAGEHRTEAFLARSPLAKVPALELDDGRVLTESRAICTYLEGLVPEPNLMGVDATERAFIEMADRRIEWSLLLGVANCIRHTHPGLAALEQPQFPEFGESQGRKVREVARWLDAELARQPFVAGKRFTIADITAFCALEFARGLMRLRPGEEGMPHLQAWRDRVAERPSASDAVARDGVPGADGAAGDPSTDRVAGDPAAGRVAGDPAAGRVAPDPAAGRVASGPAA